jgi:hypothetical protein
MTLHRLIPCLLLSLALTPAADGQQVQQVEQYGITWTFDNPATTGQFANGDWWVLGPVTIARVEPMPGPDPLPASGDAQVQSRYGAVALISDARLRNGSMVITRPSDRQGYDSRQKNFDPQLSVSFPCTLQPGQSLVSTISSTETNVPVLLKEIMWKSESRTTQALKSAAILTCVAEAPPADAFRPPYVAANLPLYRVSQIQWEKLPRLQPPDTVPAWEQFERYLQRPWLDHTSNWVFQYTGPYENQPNYGREISRVSSMASLMLMLDVPRERKQTLMIRYLQWAIDLRGLAEAGRNWNADGGHWNGRKWPMIFASILLDDPRLLPPEQTIFSEDQQTYYGQGANGETALYQIVTHTGRRQPHEEEPPDQWNASDKRAESYRTVCSVGWPGTALAAQLLGAQAAWNHDPFFDYCDRWMSGRDPAAQRKPLFGGRADPFVETMWARYRQQVHDQPRAQRSRKWVWTDKQGQFVDNARP